MTTKPAGTLFDEYALHTVAARKIRNSAEFKEECQRMLRDILQATPEIAEVCWKQWTPAFMDGDPCYFHYSEIAYRFAGIRATPEQLRKAKSEYMELENDDLMMEADEKGDGKLDASQFWCSSYPGARRSSALMTAMAKLATFQGTLGDDLESLFGNDRRITATASGLSTEHYDCGY